MNSVNLLLQSNPTWVEIKRRNKNRADIIALLPVVDGKGASRFNLVVRASQKGGASVIEQANQRQLPEFCLERHINPDGTFCLYFGSDAKLVDADAAAIWWASLSAFLTCCIDQLMQSVFLYVLTLALRH